MICPKTDGSSRLGTKFHAKEELVATGFQWTFEKTEVLSQSTGQLLTRIVIAKILDGTNIASILSLVPIRSGTPGWNCVAWVKEAIEVLEGEKETIGTCIADWKPIRNAAMKFCKEKVEEGRFMPEKYDPCVIPTYDLIQGKEVLK